MYLYAKCVLHINFNWWKDKWDKKIIAKSPEEGFHRKGITCGP